MTREELKVLTKIAQLAAERDLAALAALRAESAALAEAASALQRPASEWAEGLDPATRTGANLRWDRWRIQEMRRLQERRARLAVVEEEARETARRSFGKQVALTELQDKLA
jgi:hypothetical protein